MGSAAVRADESQNISTAESPGTLGVIVTNPPTTAKTSRHFTSEKNNCK